MPGCLGTLISSRLYFSSQSPTISLAVVYTVGPRQYSEAVILGVSYGAFETLSGSVVYDAHHKEVAWMVSWETMFLNQEKS